MELDDLKPALQSVDQRVGHALNVRLATLGMLEKAAARLGPLKFGLVVQVLAGVALTVSFAAYWTSHREYPALLLSGIALQAYSIAMLVCGAIELSMARKIDYAEPVVTIQKRLAELRAWRIRTQMWLGLPHWNLWIALTLIAFDVLFGVDLYAHAPEVVASFFVVGVLGLVLSVAFVRWALQPSHKRIGDIVERSAAGESIRKAQAFIDEIARFEQG